MRALKFRAPISRDGVKCYKYSKDYSSLGAFFDATVRAKGWLGRYEQFTGLTDKNGKEIYEGDVVRINPVDDDWNDVVVWDSGRVGFQLLSFIRRGYQIVTDVDLLRAVDKQNPCEVIGNLYENPNLVNEQSSSV